MIAKTRTLKGLLVLVVGLLTFAGAALAEEPVCIQCHAELEDHLGAPVAQWRTSIHAQNGISCHDCHGGDPTDAVEAMNPERGFIGVPDYEAVPDFCGKCHIGVKEDYLESAHGEAISMGGAQCVVCHEAHPVQRASTDIINEETCSQCHDYERAKGIKAAVVETDQILTGLSDDLDALMKQGIAIKDMEAATFAVRNDFHRVFHSVDEELVKSKTAEFQARAGEVREEIDAIHAELDDRKKIGGIVAGLFLLISIICYLIRRTYIKEEQANH